MSGNLLGRGSPSGVLEDDVVRSMLQEALASWDLGDRRVACVVPDGTRTMPLPLVARTMSEALAGVAASLDWFIALGTHQPMSKRALTRHLGLPEKALRGPAPAVRVHNHVFDDERQLVTLGEISAREVNEISEGRLSESVPVRINRRLLDADVAIVIGPVFPHEVVGFSGGTKYFFPGLSGRELIDVSHWLGALITASVIAGARGTTPVRRLIDRAAAMIPVERRCAAFVIRPDDAAVHGLYLGEVEEAWRAAADLSSKVHIRFVDEPYDTILAVAPPMYRDLWTAAKAAYKTEPIVADGGELILFAPHVTSFSETHGELIAMAGYHCRDYFLAHPERVAGIPRAVLGHATRVRGLGTYDSETGIETPRITVVLATGISKEECDRHCLEWRDHTLIEPETFVGHGRTLVVEHAGETLHRLRRRPPSEPSDGR